MRVHFVGIGGIGMSALAIHRYLSGDEVSGSDVLESERTRYLENLGIDINIGHDERNVEGSDLVVVTRAISEDNPELSKARKLGIDVVHREEFLKENVENLGESMAITGTDGKTTTTAMTFHVMKDLGENPFAFLGGISKDLDHGNYHRGEKGVVFELDESNETISIYSPTHLIITNSRGDHLENFGGSLENYYKHFKKLVENTQGIVVTFFDDEITGNLGDVTFGIEGGDYRFVDREIYGMNQTFTFKRKGRYFKVELKVPGFHNCLNALAVIALLESLGYDLENVIESLKDFEGVERRFTVSFEDDKRKIYVVDDYAHTPDEIELLIETAREVFKKKRIVAVFQPHRYTRLMRENGKFARALSKADFVYVTDVYGAFEERIDVDSSTVVENLKRFGKFSKKIDKVEDIELVQDSVYLFIGAGDINVMSREFIEVLKR